MAVRTLGQSLAPALHLYHTDTALGWRILHQITFRRGEAKVARGEMRRVNDNLGKHIGYQPVARADSRGDVDLPSQPTPVTITREQMEMNADGRSRTLGLSETQRLERASRVNPFTGKRLEPEDKAERAIRKVQVYAYVGPAKGDILKVWPLDAAEPASV